jgi:solute:Na+ symporter, SSS family
MELPVWDLLVFFLYMGGILLFGLSFYFKKRSASDFVTGGGSLPAWTLGMSIFATYVSSISFLALPGNAYQNNWNGFVFSLTIPIAAIVAVWFFIPLYRKSASPSAYVFLAERFGPWAGIYASVFYLLTQLARMGAILYLLALPMQAQFGWDITTVVLITGIAVVAYASIGGIAAVVWTDAIQGLVLIAGAIGCMVLLVWQLPGGISQLLEAGAAQQKFSLGSLDWDFSRDTFWVILIYGLFINLQNFGIDQNYIQRYKSARSTADARKSTWLGSLLYIPVSLLFFLIGTGLFVYYQQFPDYLPAHLQENGRADSVFPFFIATALPPGLSGLLIAAIFAAGMSSLSTSINSSATVLLENHYKQYLMPNPSPQQEVRFLLLASLAVGISGIAVGLAFNGVESALETWWALASVFSGGVLGLFFLALIPQQIPKPALLIAILCGLGMIGWISLGNTIDWLPRAMLHPNMAIVLGTTSICIIGFGLKIWWTKSGSDHSG